MLSQIPPSKSLGDLLVELANPAPDDYDPESRSADALFESSALLVDADPATAESARGHYVDVGRGALRSRVGVDLDDVRYAGRRVRRDMLGNGGESEGSSEGDEDSSDDEEDGGEGEGEGKGKDSEEGEEGDHDEHMDEEDEESNGSVEYGEESRMDNLDNSSAENSEGDDDREDMMHSHPARRQVNGHRDENLSDGALAGTGIEEELKRLKEEETKLASSLSTAVRQDIEKGRHVRNQMSIWDSLLDSRINVQRAVAIANRLPHHNMHAAFVSHSGSDSPIASLIASASTELVGLLDDLLTIRETLIDKNGFLTAEKSHKRKRESTDPDTLISSFWTDVSTLDSAMTSFQESTIDKWDSKVKAAQGISASKAFKAINTSVTAQIRQVLGDRDRLIKRTRLRRSGERTLGSVREDAGTKDNGDVVPDAHLVDYDPEIFDDADFYQQQLRELVDSRILDADDPIALSTRWADLRQLQLRQKRKRKVDTRASKGRKIRYHVHEKLVGFMAPEPRGTWTEERAEEFFRGLLGKPVREDAVEVVGGERGTLSTANGLRLLG